MIRGLVVTVLVCLIAAPLNSAANPPELLTSGEVEQILLCRDLERVSIATTVASLVRQGKTDKALLLLEQQAVSGLFEADRRLADGVELPAEFGSLRDAPTRARTYAEAFKIDGLRVRAAAVERKLTQR